MLTIGFQIQFLTVSGYHYPNFWNHIRNIKTLSLNYCTFKYIKFVAIFFLFSEDLLEELAKLLNATDRKIK